MLSLLLGFRYFSVSEFDSVAALFLAAQVSIRRLLDAAIIGPNSVEGAQRER